MTGSSVGTVLTEKPGAMLTQIWVPGAARDFLPRVNFQCWLSYSVCIAPRVQLHASASVRYLKIPSSGSHTSVWTQNYDTHWQKWVALLLQLLCLNYPGKVTQFPSRESVLKKMIHGQCTFESHYLKQCFIVKQFIIRGVLLLVVWVCEPAWPRGKALGWQADGRRFSSCFSTPFSYHGEVHGYCLITTLFPSQWMKH